MKLKAGDRVVIDLEMAQARCSEAISECCDRAWDKDALRRLLRCMAEGDWRVAKSQIPVWACPFCGHSWPTRRTEISLEVSSSIITGGTGYRYWAIPRSWLRLAGGS